MRTEQIFIDCDGTIVDYHDRFYIVYSIACCRNGVKPLNREEWLHCRKNEISIHTPEIHAKLSPTFEELFESPEYLCFDRLIYGMDKIIKTLQKEYDVHIVSFRAKDQNLKDQLKGYGIRDINTIVQGFSPGIVVDEKANMIRKIIPNPNGWIIGDTPYEITAGKKLGLKTIAVTYGDKSKEYLKKYNPDFIIDNPSEILEIINSN